ncbi:hypothetical protein [Acetobacter tropicalis]|uniref:Uncharacterized protein n=1 Tax=Acetobacter tropicalis TaxID=104102 RepID=A0A291PJK8_9PROT|nr:hypothetical protein [Acetobacter tropicalis]ATJ91577.1 hypothetical protein CIW82_13605 [Acetobacter tropicalis]
MTTSTNWPNPERPGVPMFPEKNGKHVINVDPEGVGSELVYYWKAKHQVWVEYDHEGPDDALDGYDLIGWAYVGPVLTSAQISEMLAGKYSIAVIQTALSVWDALDECDRTDADDMILLEQNGLMHRGIVEDANDFEDLEIGEAVWHFNETGIALVSAIRNMGAAL